MRSTRYLAIGDSLTQGRGDVHPDGTLRGFADLLAGALGDGAVYGNLARPSVRVHEVLRDQVPKAIAMAPDVVSVVAGVNDVIAVRFDTAAVARLQQVLLATLRHGLPSSRIITATLPDLSHLNVLARVWQDRVRAMNAAIRLAAGRAGVEVVDLETDHRLARADLSPDRVHPSPEGHLRIARAFGEPLGIAVTRPAYMAAAPRLDGVRGAGRALTVAPRFIGRRLAREALIAGQPPKRPDLSSM